VAETAYFYRFTFFLLYLPFFIALAGRRDKRWKGLALALCIAAMLSLSGGPGFWLVLLWLGALFSALMAIMPW
jgi:hypothetical protein